MQGVDEQTKQTLDILAVGTVAATLLQWLPAFAALFTIVWTGIRIWETETVRNFISRFRRPPE